MGNPTIVHAQNIGYQEPNHQVVLVVVLLLVVVECW